MKDSKVDYLIIGQGLAGSCLALHMLNSGKKVTVIDEDRAQTASKVAAGIYNPITGRIMTRTWMAETLFTYLHEFYLHAEVRTGSKFLFPMPMYRPFVSIEEQNEWMARSTDDQFGRFIERVTLSPEFEDVVYNPFGGLMLCQTGYLDTPKFLKAVFDLLDENDSIHTESFDEDKLRLDNNYVAYKDIQAKRIIYCVGESLTESRYWKWVPIKPLKGEVLALKSSMTLPFILNRGVYFVPETGKVGATYDKFDNTRSTTSKARAELEEKLRFLIKSEYQIIGQEWAMRPTTPDRRPILGVHPEYPQIAVFNGLGTKGVSLAPYFSGVLFRWLENEASVNEEVDLNRYKSLYWKSA